MPLQNMQAATICQALCIHQGNFEMQIKESIVNESETRQEVVEFMGFTD
jgi:hypothetical protein